MARDLVGMARVVAAHLGDPRCECVVVRSGAAVIDGQGAGDELARRDGSRAPAAAILGVDATTLRRRLRGSA